MQTQGKSETGYSVKLFHTFSKETDRNFFLMEEQLKHPPYFWQTQNVGSRGPTHGLLGAPLYGVQGNAPKQTLTTLLGQRNIPTIFPEV